MSRIRFCATSATRDAANAAEFGYATPKVDVRGIVFRGDEILLVREIMDAIRTVTGIEFTPTVAQRRTGDPARIVASGVLATRDLGWTMRHSLIEMVESAWRARQQPSS